MSAAWLKVFWHVGLTLAAAYETATAATDARRLLAGAATGWHVAAVINDVKAARLI